MSCACATHASPWSGSWARRATWRRSWAACWCNCPPASSSSPETARAFFQSLRERTPVDIVCEPRHRTWFTDEARQVLEDAGIAYVKADPPARERAPAPRDQVVYYRLHGSPKMYYSAYSEAFLDALATEISDHEQAGRRVWCIFDNTAEGAALPNALSLLHRDAQPKSQSR